MKKILFVIGTRPEIIKTAPVILTLKKDKRYHVKVCFTGQHKAMAAQMIKDFNIKVDYDLKLMKSNQTLILTASKSLLRVKGAYKDFKPDLVIVQGDTTTAFCAALSAYYLKIEVAHIEAGLRTYDRYKPYPEELNRAMISRIAEIHFAPTRQSKENLLKENIPDNSIIVTGNTTIDALIYIKNKIRSFKDRKLRNLPADKKIILVTAHRRENFGEPLKNICKALKRLAKENKDIIVVYPVHLNPNVSGTVKKILSGVKNIFLIKPVNYTDFIKLMDSAYIILTDSGGIQEEAPSLGKPVLILRNNTERPEVVEAGCAKIVGTDISKIVKNCKKLFSSKRLYRQMSEKKNPVGDGRASERIKKELDKILFSEKRSEKIC